MCFVMLKRWNLRRRPPPPQPEEDRSLQECETPVPSKVSHTPAATTATSGGKKRKATEQKVHILYTQQIRTLSQYHTPYQKG